MEIEMTDPLRGRAVQAGIVVVDTLNAPILFVEGAPSFGFSNGIVNITIAAARHLPAGDDLATDYVAVAHLRCTIPGAIDLKNAIDAALLMAKPAPDSVN
jgi:hypothetical protein